MSPRIDPAPWDDTQLLTELDAACRLERWTPDRDALCLVSADHDTEGGVSPLAGADQVLEKMRLKALAQETPPAVLLVGIRPEAALRDQLRARYGTDALLDWPGLRYLQFVFDDDDLARAAVGALQGRGARLPLPSRAELRRYLCDVKHWVDQESKAAAGLAYNCALVREGRLAFTPGMLEPKQRVRVPHRDLFTLLLACVKLSPLVGNSVLAAEKLTFDFDEMLRLSAQVEQGKREAADVGGNPPDMGPVERAFTAYEQAATVLTGHLAALYASVAASSAGKPSA